MNSFLMHRNLYLQEGRTVEKNHPHSHTESHLTMPRIKLNRTKSHKIALTQTENYTYSSTE